MRHRMKGRKLNRDSAHRKAMLMNMSISFVRHEQIQTTLAKAKELRPYIEKLVTRSKVINLHNIRYISAVISDSGTVKKLFDVLGKRYVNRPGGYTRIIKSGYRYGDNAPLAYIEFVDRDIDAKGC